MAIYQNSSFGRTEANLSKMGAYYTDISHCKDIGALLEFPKQEEVCVLEPSIGDGSAVIALTGADKNPNVKIFGVELNDTTYEETCKNPYITSCIHADFVSGVKIQKNSFSFAFGNPPYIEERTDDGEGKVRLERLFLDRIISYLKVDGVLVWVIPYKCFVETGYLRLWHSNFLTEAVYRFRPSEYAKWHQIVVIGRKRPFKKLLQNADLEQIRSDLHLEEVENLQEVPNAPDKKIVVNASSEKDITTFTTIVFDSTAAYNFLGGIIPKELDSVASRGIFQKSYVGNELLRPPIMPKKDTLYLLATSGYGSGLTGSVERKDLHLQRGVSKIVEIETPKTDEDEDHTVINVNTCSQIEVRVVENSGKITILK